MKNWLNFNWLKLVAVVVVLGALVFEKNWTLPFIYYQLMNWVVGGAFLITAWQARQQKNFFWMWLFIFSAVVFNPLAPLYLQQNVWRIIDVVAVALFVISFFFVFVKEKD
ncbi:hypothetical protein HY227_01710 [Candidatus Wolfebacteria bacterium]|nr:hypothetical protein [Candidatus Wolfebacteria bacterium]